MAWQPDAATVRRLLWHEATVHAVPDRDLRDLGDGILLIDHTDPTPFWNRLVAVRWPSDPDAFEQRLAEIRVLFAAFGRQPHVWLLPPYDEPADVATRLAANGFADTGPGCVMAARPETAAAAARAALATTHGPDIVLERASGLGGDVVGTTADAVVTVLEDAFDVDAERRPGIVAETRISLGDPRFTHYIARLDGEPVAVCRRATFDGISYLSSIGTRAMARGRGLGRLVTATAVSDALAAGSELLHLGVYDDNVPAVALYERLGFAFVGRPGPDMLLAR